MNECLIYLFLAFLKVLNCFLFSFVKKIECGGDVRPEFWDCFSQGGELRNVQTQTFHIHLPNNRFVWNLYKFLSLKNSWNILKISYFVRHSDLSPSESLTAGCHFSVQGQLERVGVENGNNDYKMGPLVKIGTLGPNWNFWSKLALLVNKNLFVVKNCTFF